MDRRRRSAALARMALAVLSCLAMSGCAMGPGKCPRRRPKGPPRVRPPQGTKAPEAKITQLERRAAQAERDLAVLKQELAEAQKLLGEQKAAAQQSEEAIADTKQRLQAYSRQAEEMRVEEAGLRRRLGEADKTAKRQQTVSKDLENLRSQFAAARLEHQAEMAAREKATREPGGEATKPGKE